MASFSNPEFDFDAFAALSDDQIDKSDIPTRPLSASVEIGKFSEIEYRGYDIRAIANWFLRKARDRSVPYSNLWLNKITSLLYEIGLRDHSVLLTPARLEAWDFGPVFRELYFQYPKENSLYKKFNIKTRSREEALEAFVESDVELFESVWTKYGEMTGGKLTSITHAPGTPWSTVWHQGGSINPGMLIDVSTILRRGK